MTSVPQKPAQTLQAIGEAASDFSSASLDDLVVAVERRVSALRAQTERDIHAVGATPLPGVKALSANTAMVRSSELFTQGWSARRYLPQMQAQSLLSSLRAGRAAEVRRVVAWLEQDVQSPETSPSPPLELHREVARAAGEPLRAWLRLHDALNPPSPFDASEKAVPARRRGPR